MPAIPLATLIPLLVGGGIAGTEIGLQVAGVGQPSSGDATKQLQAAQQAQAQADAAAKTKAIQANLANAQEASGGALSAPSLTDFASVIAGFPGESSSTAGQTALAKYLGLNLPVPGATGTTSDTMTGATYGLSGSQG